jgi:hypothetical protein
MALTGRCQLTALRVLVLAPGEASYVTGATLVVDGGCSAVLPGAGTP